MARLTDTRIVRQVAVRTLVLHDDLGLVKQPSSYPTLPDVQCFRPARFAPAGAPAARTPRLRHAA